jgi:cell volume regulation protein A
MLDPGDGAVTDVEPFGLIVFLVSAAGLLAVLSNRISELIRIPAPALFLLAGAALSDLVPSLGELPIITVERLVTVALALILFDGGMHIGWRRFRKAAGAVVWIGVVGTFVTAAAMTVLAHTLFGFDWRIAALIGTALAPTDPAVVFSVLGRREIAGRTGVILEGESGANDPVGIALMVGLIAAGDASGAHQIGEVAGIFTLQMLIGSAVGIVGGALLLLAMRRLPLPSEALYPLRTLAGSLAIYGLAAVAHGSGFLAVFIAGILIGDARTPYKGEIERFHSALASLAEIVAFAILGLTIDLQALFQSDAWWIGLLLAALLAFAVRPVLVGILLVPVRLRLGERLFVLWSGLKGAVPILLGTFVLDSGLADAGRAYDVIVVVVAFSVIVQGGLVPTVADRCEVPMRLLEPEPWELGVRLRDQPHGLSRYLLIPGARADGSRIDELDLGEDTWICFVLRQGELVPVRSQTVLQAGDEILALTDPESAHDPAPIFRDPGPAGGPAESSD